MSGLAYVRGGLCPVSFFIIRGKIHNKQRLDLYGYTASLCDCERLKAKALCGVLRRVVPASSCEGLGIRVTRVAR